MTTELALRPPIAGIDSPALEKKDWIAGLEKGLGLIEAFDDAHQRMTASQAGERCGMTRTAARRYLLTLQYLGYVASDGKRIVIGSRSRHRAFLRDNHYVEVGNEVPTSGPAPTISREERINDIRRAMGDFGSNTGRNG